MQRIRSAQWLWLCYPILGAIERDSLILMDFSLKTIDSSTHNTTTIILQHRIDRKIRRNLHASV